MVVKPVNCGLMNGRLQVKSTNFTMLQMISASLDPSHAYSLSDVLRNKSRVLVILLLLLSGNIESNPGPLTCSNLPTPADFKVRNGLGFMHMNVRSLVPEIDLIRVWVLTSDPDVLVLSETWLKKSVSDTSISIADYNLFRVDRSSKGG